MESMAKHLWRCHGVKFSSQTVVVFLFLSLTLAVDCLYDRLTIACNGNCLFSRCRKNNTAQPSVEHIGRG